MCTVCTDLSFLRADRAKVSELALDVIVLSARALVTPVAYDTGLVASLIVHAPGADKGTARINDTQVVSVKVLPVLVHVGETPCATLTLEHQAQVSLTDARVRKMEVVLLRKDIVVMFSLFCDNDPGGVRFSLFCRRRSLSCKLSLLEAFCFRITVGFDVFVTVLR